MAAMSRLARTWLFAAMAVLHPVMLPAADLEPSPPPPSQQATPAGAGPFAPPDATCLEWTDNCRTCQRPPAGEVACSNVGMACVPQPPRCTRR